MNTEIAENIKGFVFYDAKCPLCRRWIGRLHGVLVRRGLHPVPLQAAWAKRKLGMADTDPLVEMKVLTADGTIHGGVDALMEIARHIWWAWPFFIAGNIPGAKLLLRRIYGHLAANRPCDDGRCELGERPIAKHRHITTTFYEWP